MAAGTQFIGKDAILAVYTEEFGEDHPWALFQGKKRRAAGVGSEDLGRWIDRFSPAGSTATYTLCVYDTDVDPERVTSSTSELASWDFRINTYQGAGTGGGGAMGKLQQMMETDFMNRLQAVEKKMNEEPEETDGFDLNKILMDYLENPHKLAQVGGFLKQVFGGGAVGGASPQPIPATIGAFNPQHHGQDESADAQLQRLCNAIDRLQAKYPNLLPCLEKLADIAENDPLTWAMIKSKLDAL